MYVIGVPRCRAPRRDVSVAGRARHMVHALPFGVLFALMCTLWRAVEVLGERQLP